VRSRGPPKHANQVRNRSRWVIGCCHGARPRDGSVHTMNVPFLSGIRLQPPFADKPEVRAGADMSRVSGSASPTFGRRPAIFPCPDGVRLRRRNSLPAASSSTTPRNSMEIRPDDPLSRPGPAGNGERKKIRAQAAQSSRWSDADQRAGAGSQAADRLGGRWCAGA